MSMLINFLLKSVLFQFQVCRRCSAGHWLHALRSHRRAGRHAEAGEGHRLGGLESGNKNQWQSPTLTE